MSEFTIALTQFTDQKHLVGALEEMGFEVKVGVNLPLHGFRGDVREQTADIVIPRSSVNRVLGTGASNDIGFARTETGAFEAIVSEYDRSVRPKFVDQVAQTYAHRVVTETAAANGWSIEYDTVTEGGARKLKLTRWNG